jgi:transcription initiation factor TFIID subunit 1
LVLGEVLPGQELMSITNNMFFAPMFRHCDVQTDFLIASPKTKKNWIIREIPALYCVGQVQPKIEVPAPGSRLGSSLGKARLMRFIFRLLKVIWSCEIIF